MNFTQNERINQITSSTLIVGVDIAKFKHVARAQDYLVLGSGSEGNFTCDLVSDAGLHAANPTARTVDIAVKIIRLPGKIIF